MYRCITTLGGVREYLFGAKIVAFDFETAPDEPYRNEESPKDIGCPEGSPRKAGSMSRRLKHRYLMKWKQILLKWNRLMVGSAMKWIWTACKRRR